METKVVILHGFDDEEATTIMRAAKAVIKEPRSVAFAMSTPMNLEWKLGELIDHVGEEHRAVWERNTKGRLA
jgi:hypothetical protein